MGFLSRKDAARQKGSPHTKSLLIPKVNDWVLVKDQSRDIRVGKILKILNSVDGEIRKVLLEINNTQGIYPITNLRFLEAGTNNDTYGSDKNVNINEEVITRLKKPQRKAAIVALEKMKDCQ